MRASAREATTAARENGGVASATRKPRLRFHDLRHTYASMLIGQGEDVTYVAAQLGHASPRITLEVYARLFDRQRRAAQSKARLESAYGAMLDAVSRGAR